MKLLVTLTLVPILLFSAVGPLLALTRDAIGVLAFQVVHSRDDAVKKAWDLLVEKGVMVERAESQWDLASLYPRETHPEIAEAIVVLQTAKILDARPLNQEGSDNAVEILVDKEEIFPRALEMIGRAKRTVRFNIFLWGGTIGLKLVEAFKAAQDRGVDVQIITMPDSDGSATLEKLKEISNKLAGDEPLAPYKPVKADAEAAGLNLGFYPTDTLNGKAFVKADHNKMLSIDTTEALIGGMNFADVVQNNHDLMLWIKGPAVRELDEIFNDNWRLCRKVGEGNAEATPLFNNDEVLDAATEKMSRDLARVVVTYSNTFVNATRGMVAELIDGAQKKLRIMMFTFVDDDTVERVIKAHERGVDVKVLLDPNVHAFGLRLMGAPNITTVRQLKKAGIPVQAYKTRPGAQMHIKACMVDDRFSCFGSTNWTKAGFDSNNETFVRVESADVAEDLEALFDLDWESYSYELKSDGLGKWLLSTVVEAFDNGF